MSKSLQFLFTYTLSLA